MKGPRGGKVERTVRTTTTTRWEFTADELKKRLRLPPDCRLFVQVPGGGDWSNTDLDIDLRPLVAVAVDEGQK